MKKVGTVAATQNKNFFQQKLTIGLDLGDRNSWYCVLDEAGRDLHVRRCLRPYHDFQRASPVDGLGRSTPTRCPNRRFW